MFRDSSTLAHVSHRHDLLDSTLLRKLTIHIQPLQWLTRSRPHPSNCLAHHAAPTLSASRKKNHPTSPSHVSTTLNLTSPHPETPMEEKQTNYSLSAAMLNDAQPTPTPDTANMANPMATAIAPVPTPARAPQPPRESQNHYDTTPVPIPAATLRNGTPQLQVQLLSSAATAPTKGSAFAAGHDIYASKDTTIPARGRAMVDTDIAMAIPDYSYGRVAPRSGLAVKHGINVGAGVIDQDYRGQVKVLLFNMSDEDFAVKKGDRIAQIIMEMVSTPNLSYGEVLRHDDDVVALRTIEDIRANLTHCGPEDPSP